jgi:hypothetical protein
MNSFETPARVYAPGMGEAVANRTINRKLPGGLVEKWSDVALRVAVGNALLAPDHTDYEAEFHAMHHHLRQGSLLMSGRHLQHGDDTQPTRNMEVFTNCATAATTFLSFQLLLNGSGVGRAYDDAMMKVDWSKLPIVAPVIDQMHPDVQTGEIKFGDAREASHLYAGRTILTFMVPDTREGWSKAIEQMERMAFEGDKREAVLLLDFSDVRCKGSPIKGMQNRPASGPCPLMVAIANMAKLRDAGCAPWRAAMYADDYSAQCVLVGGARRAARMATKTWRDKSVLEFIAIKQGGFLWTSNNSVTVDKKFWRYVAKVQTQLDKFDESMTVDKLVEMCRVSEFEAHAYRVFEAVCQHSYYDGTGEPGFINQDKLTFNPEGIEKLLDGDFADSAKFSIDPETLPLMKAIARAFVKSPFKVITNPCGEIVLIMLGGYCVIADIVMFHALHKGKTKEMCDADAEDAFRAGARALIRTNLMDSLYKKEVARTNRIGVGFTGFHEWAFARFGYGWKDIVNEEVSLPMWKMMSRFKRAIVAEVKAYSEKIGVVCPHTDTTVKPAGTTSKLFGLTEGAHLPSMREYLRWVQFRNGDPLIKKYSKLGYPVRELQKYSGTTIVGFPTAPVITTLGMGDKLVTAGEATPDEQYAYLKLLEKWWIRGMEEDGVTPLAESGNQVSYTLKYKPNVTDYASFRRAMLEHQSNIRCCSVMPQEDTDGPSPYEYLPEQSVTKQEYELIVAAIQDSDVKEDIGKEHIDCASGACPVDFSTNSASVLERAEAEIERAAA